MSTCGSESPADLYPHPTPWPGMADGCANVLVIAARPYGCFMPDAHDHPIAYTALQPGTPVQTSDGKRFSTVQAVLVDEKVSVFDGIVVQTEEGPRFVDADQIDTIHPTYVRTTLSPQQAVNLPPP